MITSTLGFKANTPPPPSFAKCPFFGSKVPFFLCEKCHEDCIFYPKGTWNWNLKLCYFWKFFVISEKNITIRKIFWVCPENFFEMTSPPPSPTFPVKKFLEALFYSKSALQIMPPPNFYELPTSLVVFRKRIKRIKLDVKCIWSYPHGNLRYRNVN